MSQFTDGPPPFLQRALPVEPVTYYQTGTVVRQGIVTAMGVMSIIVAVVSILTSGLMALWGLGMSMASVSMRSTGAGITRSTSSAVVSQTGATADDGLSSDDRQTVVRGLEQVRRVNDARRRQLDELLAEHGKQIIDVSGANLTVALIAAGVSSSGRLQSAAGGDDGAEFFVLGQGRIELTDAHAVYFPSNGQPALRSTAIPIANNDSSTNAFSMETDAGAPLSPSQINAVVRRITQLGARLNAAQTKRLTQTLQDPGEQLVLPAKDDAGAASQISSAMMLGGGGTVMITTLHGTGGGSISMDAAGNINSSTYTSTGAVPVLTGKINLLWPVLATVGVGLQLALAIFLLISGILVLRQSSRGAFLHWIYIWAKLPLAILTGALTAWAVYQFFNGMFGGVRPQMNVVVVTTTVPFAVGCIYPIALIFVLRSPTVRAYYSGVR